MTDRDTLFAAPRPPAAFRFDADVAAVFPDMIARSVPGYALVVQLAAQIAARHVPEGGLCFDLGCSLGATSLALAGALEGRAARIVAVDNAAAMLARAREHCAGFVDAAAGPRIEFRQDDLRAVDCTGAHAIVLAFTLQFVPPDDRAALLARWRATMHPEGVLVIADKVAAAPASSAAARVTAWDEQRHLDFKRAQGYSELEIAQKRNALLDVLVPDTIATHEARLHDAGFASVHCFFRCLNWAAFAASPHATPDRA